MKIEEIQEWEKEFSKRKGLPPDVEAEPHEGIVAGFLKLSEEMGELSEAILKKRYDEISSEVSDIVIFACKIAKIAEDHFKQRSLSDVLEQKIRHSEGREYDKSSGKLNKPNGEFKPE